MTAEEYIAAKLDGNFWYIDQETHKVLHRSVPKDYEPVFKPAYVYVSNNMAAHVKRRDWTADEDDRIMEFRATRTPWHDMQKILHRGITQLRARYKELCAQRGCVARIGQPREYSEWSDEFKADLRRMRFDNMTFAAIASKSGVTAHNVRAYFQDCAPELVEARTETLKKRQVANRALKRAQNTSESRA